MLGSLFLAACLLSVAHGQAQCWDGDEDCGVCPDPASSISFNAYWLLSGLTAPIISFERNVSAAETAIRQLSPAPGDVLGVVDPWVEAHVTLKYFCCLNIEAKQRVLRALQQFNWTAIEGSFSRFHCNVDHTGVPIYLHAHPVPQDPFFALVRSMESFLADRGVRTAPRMQPFHLTLARVNNNYPVDKWVAWANATAPSLGTRKLSSFWIGPDRYDST